MIDISFLRPQQVSGMEFMEFQTRQFFNELRDLVELYIDRSDKNFVLKGSVEKDLYTIIEKYTGFKNIRLHLENHGNLGVDTGYFNPRNILNNAGLDDHFSPMESTLGNWFKKNKDKHFKGAVDFKTGKVSGSFADLPVGLYINRNLSSTFPDEFIQKYKTNVASLLAGVLVHELGHIFGGCMMMAQNIKDNYIMKAVIDGVRGAKSREQIVMVIKDASALLELEKANDKDLIEVLDAKNKEVATLIYFTKMIEARTTRRSLSLGVPKMTSEVLADAYAIRMGCERGLLPALAILAAKGQSGLIKNGMFMSLIILIIGQLFFGLITVIVLMSGWFGLLQVFLFMTLADVISSYLDNTQAGDYNNPYRRLDDGIRQLIAKLRASTLPPADIKPLLKEIDHFLEIRKSLTPMIDNTALYRFYGWLCNGSDFKRSEFEHYSQVLANHEINLLGHKLGQLTA